MKHMKNAIAVMSLLAIIPAAHADLLLSDYKRDKNSDSVKQQMMSIYEGMSYASLSLPENKIAPLFCPPGKFIVQYNHLSTFLDKQIFTFETVMKDKGGLNYGLPVAPILLIALKKEFPCNQK